MTNALLCNEAVRWSEKQDILVLAEQCLDNQVTKLALSQRAWISLHDIASYMYKSSKVSSEEKTSLWRLYDIFLENEWPVMSDHI